MVVNVIENVYPIFTNLDARIQVSELDAKDTVVFPVQARDDDLLPGVGATSFLIVFLLQRSYPIALRMAKTP